MHDDFDINQCCEDIINWCLLKCNTTLSLSSWDMYKYKTLGRTMDFLTDFISRNLLELQYAKAQVFRASWL